MGVQLRRVLLAFAQAKDLYGVEAGSCIWGDGQPSFNALKLFKARVGGQRFEHSIMNTLSHTHIPAFENQICLFAYS
jgi:hypothetical protein